jgi:sporulation protein YlmC with PRC-barrel domain
MIDLPAKAEVHCSDGAVGRSTYIIGNPISHQITHLVVKSNRTPFKEYLVPVDQVEETTPELIRLKCTRNDLYEMEPFEYEEYIRTETPGHLSWPYVLPMELYPEEVVSYIPVKFQNVPQGELAVRRGARVEATDGYIGQVDELLINSNNMQVTHLVLLERHILKQREITIPISQIDHIFENTIYLKLDRRSVEDLPTTPMQRWAL